MFREDHVPVDHLLRRIDRDVDLDWLRAALSPISQPDGAPSVDPEPMIRMLLIADCIGIRPCRAHAYLPGEQT